MEIRAANPSDYPAIAAAFCTRWGSTQIALRGRLLNVFDLPILLALRAKRICGIVSYEFHSPIPTPPDSRLPEASAEPPSPPPPKHPDLEIFTLDALEQRQGVGSALLGDLLQRARRRGAGRIVVVTTNDNLDALRFYQRRGFTIAALRPGAVADARRQLKPVIPETGCFGIPIRDEIELELRLFSPPDPVAEQRGTDATPPA